MTDNHKAYTSLDFQALLAELGARHIPTPPYTPRWNGKLERFNHTLDDEWAHGRGWPNSAQPRPRPAILPALLQPPPTTHLAQLAQPAQVVLEVLGRQPRVREADPLQPLAVDQHHVGGVVELAALRRDPVAAPHRRELVP